MRKALLFLMMISFLASCKKEQPTVFGCTDPSATNYSSAANTDNGTCEYTGKAMFWYNSNGTSATVYVGGYTGSITQYYAGYDPNCGASGCANFTLPIGTYSFYAESTFSTWSGTITVTKNGCSK